MAVDVGSAVGYLDLDISGFLNGLKSAQDEAGKTSTSITDKLDAVGSKLSKTGTKMTALVTTPIVGAGTAAVKTAANFESAMSKVSAISGATGDDLDALTEKAKEMGETTKFSASESADAFQYMAMAGWKTEQMLDGIEGIMNLAAASGEDLATTSDIVTDALTAFGLGAEDSAHFADVLAAASSNANTNVSMLGESFKYVAPLAGALGYTTEDVGVALGLMANAGIKAGQAGTSLRSAISGLISPSKEAAGWMEELGISITNEDGSMKSLAEVMDMLREKMAGLSESEQAEAASAMFGERAMSGMLAIVNASTTDYQKLTDALANADGTAKNMADTMNDNLNGQLTLLKSQIEGVAIKLGNILIPIIKQIVDKISEWVDWFSNLSTEQQKLILKIAGIVAVIGPLLLIIGKIITAVSTVIKIINAIKTAMIALNAVMLANPIFLIVAAIAALIAIFVLLWNKCEGFRNFWKGLWEEIKKTVEKYLDAIVGFFKVAWEIIKTVWNAVKDFFKGIWDGIKEVFSDVKDFFVSRFKQSVENIKIVWNAITGFFKGIWNGIKNIFKSVGEWFVEKFKYPIAIIITIWSKLREIFQAIWEAIKQVFAAVGNWFGEKFQEAIDSIKAVWSIVVDFFSGIWNGIKNVFSSVGNWFKERFQEAVDRIKLVFAVVITIVQNVRNKVNEIFSAIGNWFKERFQEAVNNIKAVFSVIGNFFQGIWDKVSGVFSNVGNWFKDKFTEAWNNIKAVFSGIGEFFSGIWDKIKNIFKNVGTKIGEAFSGAFKSVVNHVFEFIENRINDFIDKLNGILFILNKIPGVDINPVSYVSLPRLAKGALAYGPTAAIIGDNPNARKDPEVVSPLSKLKEMMVGAIDITPMVILMEELVKVSKANYDINLTRERKTNVIESDISSSHQNNAGGGDTYIFNSPKVIDEEEAAAQIKRIKRDIAEGF